MRELKELPAKPWAASGNSCGKQRLINSIYMTPDTLEKHNHELFETYALMSERETAAESYKTEDAEVVLTAYGMVARICKAAVDILRERGVKAGLIRPITLYPFPSAVIRATAEQKSVKRFVCVELSMGQMIEDVRLAVNGLKPVQFYGRVGGNVMLPEEVADFIKEKVQ